jgi:hypothetical protein
MKIIVKDSGAFYDVTLATETFQLQFEVIKTDPFPISLTCEREVLASLFQIAHAQLQSKRQQRVHRLPVALN